MNLELRHLRYFVAVAEELHFGHAAERLSIAQPSLSQQIRKLERQVGADLFIRNSRQVRLSPAGEAFLPGAIRTLEESRTAMDRAREAGAGITGHLTVGFIETAAITVVPEAVRRFHADHPRIGLTLLELGVEDQIQGLISGRLDLGFVRKQPDIEGLVTETVLEEQLVVAVPAGHELADRDSVSTNDLAGQPLVAVERAKLPDLYDETVKLISEQDGAGEFAQKASSVLAVLGLVSARLGLAIVPGSVQALGLSGVVFVPLLDSPGASILVVSSERSPSLLRRYFLDAVRAGVRTQGKGAPE